jgi:hypothetical protein
MSTNVHRTTTAALAVLGLTLLLTAPAALASAQDESLSSDKPQIAQQERMGPPPIILIYHEDVKAGRTESHDKLEAAWARTYAKMGNGSHYIAMNSVSGPPEAWFIEGHADMIEVEKNLTAVEKAPAPIKTALSQLSGQEIDNLNSMRLITAAYRADLSLNADDLNLPKMRFMEVTTYHVRPGHSADFVQAAKLARTAYEKASPGEHWAVYQVMSGTTNGTFYIFNPVESLAKLNPDEKMDKAFHDALGDDGMKKLSQLVAEGIVNSETDFFAFNPQMSYAPPDFVTADAFWAPKDNAVTAMVGTSGKTAPAKKQQVMPAVKKDKQ